MERDYLAMARAEQAYTVKLRRYFHQHPEVGPAEQVETMDAICRELEALGIPYEWVPGGGVLGFLGDPARGRTVLLRADIDALPIQEDPCNLKGPRVCVSQKPGAMHACGHDAHIAMLLTEAKLLKAMEAELKGAVLLVFEEGEEGHGNIEALLRYMDQRNLRADTCYATHVRWDLDAGKLCVVDGTAMSGLYIFHCELHGLSGHGSRPDLARSTLDCFVNVYDLLQTVRMDHLGPDKRLTFSVGKVTCGTADNVIPDYLVFEGTVRFFERDSGKVFWEEFKRILKTICEYHGCTYSLTCRYALLPSISDRTCRRLWERAVERHLGRDCLGECEPWMASESYSYFLSMCPGILAFTGIRNEALGSGANHHTPQFDLDEAALPVGVASALAYTLDFLEEPPQIPGFRPLCGSAEEIIRLNHPN